MSITITDVARLAGVSKSTISRYLNGRYECMGVETKTRIAQVIQELDYHPNILARSLTQKQTHTVAAVIANILNPFSTSIIRGIEDYCQKVDYNLFLCNADEDSAKEKEYLRMLTAKQIDGLIINTTGSNNQLMMEINRTIPIVLLDRKVPEIQTDTVTVDSELGAYLAVSHLLKLGYKTIVMFTLPAYQLSPRLERIQGYKRALRDNGLEFSSELLVETDGSLQDVSGKFKEILAAYNNSSLAVFGANNLVTMNLVKTAKRMKISIPGETAIIGFDDWEWAELIDPPVTVISQPTYDIGVKAAELLIKRIQTKQKVNQPCNVVFKPELIVRKSCGE